MLVVRSCRNCPVNFACEKPLRGTARSLCAACKRAAYVAGYRKQNAKYAPVPRALVMCCDCGAPARTRPPNKQGGGQNFKRCEACQLAKDRAKWARQRILRHGITVAQYEALLIAQGGTCAVIGCDLTDDGAGRSLHIDHDHSCCPGDKSCGECVRGLLCARHNVGFGYFADDPAALRAAADYIERTAIRKVNAA